VTGLEASADMADDAAHQTSKRVQANLVLSLLAQALGILSQFATVPAFLAAWGDALYGDWLTLSALSSYISLSDAGLQMYVTNRLTGQIVRSEYDEFDRTWQSSLGVYIIVSTVVIATLLVFATGVVPTDWLGTKVLPANATSVVFTVLGLATLAMIWNGLFAAMYRVAGAAHLATGVGVLARGLSLATTLIALYLHLPPLHLAIVTLAIPLAMSAFIAHHAQRLLDRPLFTLRRADRRTGLELLVPSALFAVATLANGLTVQGTLLVTAWMIGPVQVTTFATSRTLASTIRQFVGLFNSVAWPEYTRLEASGNSTNLGQAHDLVVKTAASISAALVAWLWFSGPALYDIWTNGRSQPDSVLFRVMLLHALLQSPSWASAVVLTATNHHRQLAWLTLVQGIGLVALTPFAISMFGLKGVGFAMLLIDVPLFCMLVPVWTARVLRRTSATFILRTYVYTLALCGVASIGVWLVTQLGLGPLPTILLSALTSALTTAAAGLLWLSPRERALMSRVLGARFTRRHS